MKSVTIGRRQRKLATGCGEMCAELLWHAIYTYCYTQSILQNNQRNDQVFQEKYVTKPSDNG